MRTLNQYLRILIIFAILFILACTTTTSQMRAGAPCGLRDTHERLHGTLFMQTAAEYDTLCRVAYNQARASLDAALKDNSWTAAIEQGAGYDNLPVALIVDLDETILDNSRFQGRLTKDRIAYNDALWNDWVKKHEAGAIPGAVEFLEYAASRGVVVFYITNRNADEESDTRANLAALSLPLPQSPDVVLARGENGWTSSDKSARRAEVAKHYRILLLIGDDLGDFTTGAKDMPANRLALASSHAKMWGSRWILLPNAQYGSWESALYDHDFSLPDSDVLARKFAWIEDF